MNVMEFVEFRNIQFKIIFWRLSNMKRVNFLISETNYYFLEQQALSRGCSFDEVFNLVLKDYQLIDFSIFHADADYDDEYPEPDFDPSNGLLWDALDYE